MPEETLAGYRLLRKLGSGSRADVYLGHAGAAQPRTVALKRFHPATPIESIDAEVRALSTTDHAHIVQLRDLSSAGDGRPVLILERLESWSLGQLLASRSTLGAGEAVTVLAPLVAAVAAMHESGVVHAGITPGRLLFRESGAPVLSGFGHAGVLSPQGAELDNRSVAALAAGVLERVDSAVGLREWLGALTGHPDAFLARLTERLFDFADATPVRFSVDGALTEMVPARTAPATIVEIAADPVAPAATPSPTSAMISTLADRAASYLARIPPRFRRPRYAALAAGALALIIAIAVVPSGEDAVAELTPTAAPSAVAAGPVVADDPLAAFADLLRLRDQCIRDLSILCLDAVVQPNSAAMDDDVALIRSIQRGDGGEALRDVRNVVLVERMGDAVLLSYEAGAGSEPASVLLAKGEAGWRIRSYIPG